MAKRRGKRIIQVPIDEDLLKHLDATAGVVAESRAAFIREACRLRLRDLALKELDRRYVEGYRKKPEKETLVKDDGQTPIACAAQGKVVDEARRGLVGRTTGACRT